MPNDSLLGELVMKCAEHPAPTDLKKLYELLAEAGNPIPAATAEPLNLLWESWSSADPLPTAARDFVLETGLLPLPENPLFREVLAAAIKQSLPPYLNRTAYLRALGLRDDKIPTRELVQRFRKLLQIKSGVMLFLTGTSRWGTAGNLDSINGTISMSPFAMAGGMVALPLETALAEAVLLTAGPEMLKLVAPNRQFGAADFRALVQRKALTPVTDGVMQKMALAGCARGLSPEAFESWWRSNATSAAPGGGRRAAESRSLKEMDLLLAKEEEAGNKPLTPEEAAGFEKFFTALKADTAAREAKLLAGIVIRLQGRAQPEELRRILSPLRAKAPFWPADPARAQLTALSVWGELPAKSMEAMAAATAELFPEEYLACCAVRLPLKALNAVIGELTDDLILDYFHDLRNCGADLMLWVWKNRKKHSEELLQLLGFDSVIRALSQDDLPKAWGAAQRELRALFLDNADFQKQLIATAGDDPRFIAATLQGAIFLLPGERQSLLVKLARHSEALRDYIENGAGKRILQAGVAKSDQTVGVPTAVVEPNYTSRQSHARLLQELDHLINVLVPENREALKAARAHGDFRENSEFDAAKERRNFLSRRRGELERELANVQPVVFGTVTVTDTAVIGCEVVLEYLDNGEQEHYYLLGAWDGNPEKNYLSYRTRLGQAIHDHKVGEELPLPGGRKARLAAVKPLPESVLAETD